MPHCVKTRAAAMLACLIHDRLVGRERYTVRDIGTQALILGGLLVLAATHVAADPVEVKYGKYLCITDHSVGFADTADPNAYAGAFTPPLNRQKFFIDVEKYNHEWCKNAPTSDVGAIQCAAQHSVTIKNSVNTGNIHDFNINEFYSVEFPMFYFRGAVFEIWSDGDFKWAEIDRPDPFIILGRCEFIR
jgi:hypothetical protein